MIYTLENKSTIQAIFKQALPNLFAVIFFTLQLSNISPDISQKLNTFEDATVLERTLDSDDEKNDYFINTFYVFKFHYRHTYTLTRLKRIPSSTHSKYSYFSRAPPIA